MNKEVETTALAVKKPIPIPPDLTDAELDRLYINRRCPESKILETTRFTQPEVRLIRRWLEHHHLTALNLAPEFWAALDYFIGESSIESFSINAVEAATEDLVTFFVYQENLLQTGRRNRTNSQAAYRALKVVRALRTERDLQLRQRKVQLTIARVSTSANLTMAQRLQLSSARQNQLPGKTSTKLLAS